MADFTGPPESAMWLPNERFAKQWAEYVQTGSIVDTTAPPAPTGVTATAKDGVVQLKWEAEADFESGIASFVIQRDGKDLSPFPEKPIGRFGRALFQTMSYHDTPEKPLAEMQYIDKTTKPGETHEYRVIAVNSVGLKSGPSKPASVK